MAQRGEEKKDRMHCGMQPLAKKQVFLKKKK
jgi:hypothetical protein